jgi:hypothetical protein
MVRRGEITDEAWGHIASLLPESGLAAAGATTARW